MPRYAYEYNGIKQMSKRAQDMIKHKTVRAVLSNSNGSTTTTRSTLLLTTPHFR
jgi:hypothetical protein